MNRHPTGRPATCHADRAGERPGDRARNRRVGRRQRSVAGFSLLEATIALALLGLVLAMSLTLLFELPRHRQRMAAERDAVRALEATLESLRAGVLPLATGPVDPALALPRPPRPGLVLGMEVEPARPRTLHQVTLTARYFVLGQHRQRQVTTMVWRP